MTERRETDRCELQQYVQINAHKDKWVKAQTMDISENGMRIRFDEALAAGAWVDLKLDFLHEDLPDENLEVSAVVMHRFREPGGDNWQVGVKLVFKDQAHKEALQTALTTCKSYF